MSAAFFVLLTFIVNLSQVYADKVDLSVIQEIRAVYCFGDFNSTASTVVNNVTSSNSTASTVVNNVTSSIKTNNSANSTTNDDYMSNSEEDLKNAIDFARNCVMNGGDFTQLGDNTNGTYHFICVYQNDVSSRFNITDNVNNNKISDEGTKLGNNDNHGMLIVIVIIIICLSCTTFATASWFFIAGRGRKICATQFSSDNQVTIEMNCVELIV